MSKARVLVVDDEETIRKLLKSRLDREGYDVAVASSAVEAEKIFAEGADIGVMVTDLRMPGKDGFALMKWAREKYTHLKVVVITGHGEKEVAVQALRSGAADYLEKPFDMDELSHAVKRGLHEYKLENDNADLVDRLEARVQRVEGRTEDSTWYVSKANAMSKVNEWVTVLRREAMRGEAEEPSVLILGASGTGKEGIARMIHAGSRRGKGAWVAVNCANFSEQLLESELFGHERGAFTGANTLKRGLFELARGGTLFLDELGEMETKLQAKLLRVLQEKVFRRVGGNQDIESDVRIIAATNLNLADRVQKGKFREDLFHRLNRVTVELPTLAERKEDIIPMSTQFIERAFQARGKNFAGFTPEAQAALSAYPWPGNVRELLNVVERAALVFEGKGTLTAKALSLPAVVERNLQMVKSPNPTIDPEASYSEMKKSWTDSFEKEFLISMLQKHHGNVSGAARSARIDRSNFLRLLRRHGVASEGFRAPGATSTTRPPAPTVVPVSSPDVKKTGTGEEAA